MNEFNDPLFWYFSCRRKKQYKVRIWAEEALDRGQKKGHYSPTHRIYPCKICFSYHIGRPPKNESRPHEQLSEGGSELY